MSRSGSTPPAPPDPQREIRRLSAQIHTLTAEAQHNETVLKHFHEREFTLLGTEKLPRLLEELTRGLRRSFALEAVTLILHDPDHELRHLLLYTGSPPGAHPDIRLLDRLDTLNPILGRLRRPLLGPYLGEDHAGLFDTGHEVRSIALLPLLRHDLLVGSLNLGSRDPRRFTSRHASDFLHHMATIGAICLENIANRERLVLAGLTDPLTSLHNRAYLESRLQEEIEAARRYRHPLSCLFADIDHFKRVNDQHGHDAGDQVLRETALRIKGCLRASDIATRYGGEEFALLLPQTGPAEALQLARRIRHAIAATPIPSGHGRQLDITLSIGVGSLSESMQTPQEQLLQQADQALYRAKRQGRNRAEGTT